MNQLFHGAKVKYNGYKTGPSGSTVDAICVATVIGWDEETIYTEIKLAGDDRGKCYYWDPEIIKSHMVWTDFRLGFHRSRLIGVIDEVKIEVNHSQKQAVLF